MAKKIFIILGLCILVGYLIFAFFFFEDKPEEKICGSFELVLDNELHDHFVDEATLEKFIAKQGLNPYGKPLKEINTYAIQEVLLSNELLESVEVYVTNSGGIKAIIKERVPILRIIPSEGKGYYIDKAGKIMPLSEMSTAYLPVATGNINEAFASTVLYKFALFLQEDEFWNAQIEQIVVHSSQNIEIVTRVGDQHIVIGSLDNYESKLEKLKKFYKKVLSQSGWNKYSKINLKYDKQVVATKR